MDDRSREIRYISILGSIKLTIYEKRKIILESGGLHCYLFEKSPYTDGGWLIKDVVPLRPREIGDAIVLGHGIDKWDPIYSHKWEIKEVTEIHENGDIGLKNICTLPIGGS
jgi:hypothetical protein